jgi:hypothetical protein
VKVRADIAKLLRAGVPRDEIARTLHVAPLTVQRTREALGMPAPPRRRRLPATPEEAFYQHTEPVPGGHLRWTIKLSSVGRPVFGYQDGKISAYPLAFLIRWGREPVGQVQPGCDFEGCMAPEHVEDRPMREKNRAAYAAIFGNPP